MTQSPLRRSTPSSPEACAVVTPLERLRFLRDIVSAEADTLQRVAGALGPETVRAAELTADCTGAVLVTGIGKAGLIGQKLVATLASTGTPAHFLHPAEAIHGDLGRVGEHDLVWALSNSGRSEEVLRILPSLRQQASGVVALTADVDNPLAVAADCVVVLGRHDEACPLGLAPSSSTAAMLAVGDAIALLASRLRGFSQYDFARFHPGGSLGRKLARVEQLMRPRDVCRVAPASGTIRQTMVAASRGGRRSGAVMLVDANGRLAGIFTDSDLARLLESRSEGSLDDPVAGVMTRQVQTVRAGTLLRDAIAVLAGRKISELPVLNPDGVPLGLLDITDVVSLTEPDGPSTVPLRGA